MSEQQANVMGRATILALTLLQLKDAIAGIGGHFKGCKTLLDVLHRLVTLDDATLIGVVVLAAVAGWIIVSFFRPGQGHPRDHP